MDTEIRTSLLFALIMLVVCVILDCWLSHSVPTRQDRMNSYTTTMCQWYSGTVKKDPYDHIHCFKDGKELLT